MSEPDYPFVSSEHERQRLMRQADVLSEATERLFRKSGIGLGMRVLDVGSGAGDVALLARRLVGETGEVIGTDRDETQVAFASRRAQSLSSWRGPRSLRRAVKAQAARSRQGGGLEWDQ